MNRITVDTARVNGKRELTIDDHCIISRMCLDDDDTFNAIQELVKAHCNCNRDGIEFRAQITTTDKEEAKHALETMQKLRDKLEKQSDDIALRKLNFFFDEMQNN